MLESEVEDGSESKFEFEFEFALGRRPGGRSQTPPGNVPGGTPGAHPRDRPEAPRRDPEKHQLEELGKSQRAVEVSPLNCRVAFTKLLLHRQPIPPRTPPSHPPKGMAYATTQARGARRELP